MQRFLEALRELSKGEREARVKGEEGRRNHLISNVIGNFQFMPHQAGQGRHRITQVVSMYVPASAVKDQQGPKVSFLAGNSTCQCEKVAGWSELHPETAPVTKTERKHVLPASVLRR